MASISERTVQRPSERPVIRKPPLRRSLDLFQVWNRKLHFYTGLYFLLFLWLFSFTGLMLNHSGWSISNFWPQRIQTAFERPIHPPSPGGDLAEARDLMGQLGLHGEVEWTVTHQQPGHFDFRVIRPGHVYEVKTDWTAGRASINEVGINTWGIMHVLHTFTGVRLTDVRMQRDWVMTSLWALSMDALAAGLIFMVLSSYYMWYLLKQKRRLGIVVLLAGFASCGFFLVGLRWMASS